MRLASLAHGTLTALALCGHRMPADHEQRQPRAKHGRETVPNIELNDSEHHEAGKPEWLGELPQIPSPATSIPQSSLLLVGLPGSGKSMFSTALCQRMPWKYIRINQDELKGRPACERAMRKTLADGKCPIIDRCNVSVSQRQKFQANVPIDCIVFDIAAETCLRRCQERRNHPTVAPNEAKKIIGWQLKDYEAPSASEGFRTITTIRDDASFKQVLMDLIMTKE